MITYGDTLDQKQLDKVVDSLKAGCVIIIPTDSFYCFVCDINNHKAAQRLARIKNKKLENRFGFAFIQYLFTKLN